MIVTVSHLLGRVAGWLFVGVVAALSGFGIYLGRFLRFNSWDIVYRPIALWRGIGNWAAVPMAHSNSYAFPVLFATFLFIAYLMLYALTHLNDAHAGALHDDGGAGFQLVRNRMPTTCISSRAGAAPPLDTIPFAPIVP